MAESTPLLGGALKRLPSLPVPPALSSGGRGRYGSDGRRYGSDYDAQERSGQNASKGAGKRRFSRFPSLQVDEDELPVSAASELKGENVYVNRESDDVHVPKNHLSAVPLYAITYKVLCETVQRHRSAGNAGAPVVVTSNARAMDRYFHWEVPTSLRVALQWVIPSMEWFGFTSKQPQVHQRRGSTGYTRQRYVRATGPEMMQCSFFDYLHVLIYFEACQQVDVILRNELENDIASSENDGDTGHGGGGGVVDGGETKFNANSMETPDPLSQRIDERSRELTRRALKLKAKRISRQSRRVVRGMVEHLFTTMVAYGGLSKQHRSHKHAPTGKCAGIFLSKRRLRMLLVQASSHVHNSHARILDGESSSSDGAYTHPALGHVALTCSDNTQHHQLLRMVAYLRTFYLFSCAYVKDMVLDAREQAEDEGKGDHAFQEACVSNTIPRPDFFARFRRYLVVGWDSQTQDQILPDEVGRFPPATDFSINSDGPGPSSASDSGADSAAVPLGHVHVCSCASCWLHAGMYVHWVTSMRGARWSEGRTETHHSHTHSRPVVNEKSQAFMPVFAPNGSASRHTRDTSTDSVNITNAAEAFLPAGTGKHFDFQLTRKEGKPHTTLRKNRVLLAKGDCSSHFPILVRRVFMAYPNVVSNELLCLYGSHRAHENHSDTLRYLAPGQSEAVHFSVTRYSHRNDEQGTKVRMKFVYGATIRSHEVYGTYTSGSKGDAGHHAHHHKTHATSNGAGEALNAQRTTTPPLARHDGGDKQDSFEPPHANKLLPRRSLSQRSEKHMQKAASFNPAVLLDDDTAPFADNASSMAHHRTTRSVSFAREEEEAGTPVYVHTRSRGTSVYVNAVLDEEDDEVVLPMGRIAPPKSELRVREVSSDSDTESGSGSSSTSDSEAVWGILSPKQRLRRTEGEVPAVDDPMLGHLSVAADGMGHSHVTDDQPHRSHIDIVVDEWIMPHSLAVSSEWLMDTSEAVDAEYVPAIARVYTVDALAQQLHRHDELQSHNKRRSKSHMHRGSSYTHDDATGDSWTAKLQCCTRSLHFLAALFMTLLVPLRKLWHCVRYYVSQACWYVLVDAETSRLRRTLTSPLLFYFLLCFGISVMSICARILSWVCARPLHAMLDAMLTQVLGTDDKNVPLWDGGYAFSWTELWYAMALCRIVCMLASVFVTSFCPHTAGSGIPEIRATLNGSFRMPGFFSWQSGVCKFLAMCLVAGSGLPFGQEGPFIHISCCYAELLKGLHDRAVTFVYTSARMKRRWESAAFRSSLDFDGDLLKTRRAGEGDATESESPKPERVSSAVTTDELPRLPSSAASALPSEHTKSMHWADPLASRHLSRTAFRIAASAAGIASLLKAPIGAVLFTIEITQSYFKVSHFGVAFFAAVASLFVSHLVEFFVFGSYFVSSQAASLHYSITGASTSSGFVASLMKPVKQTSLWRMIHPWLLASSSNAPSSSALPESVFSYAYIDMIYFLVLGSIIGVVAVRMVHLHRLIVYLRRKFQPLCGVRVQCCQRDAFAQRQRPTPSTQPAQTQPQQQSTDPSLPLSSAVSANNTDANNSSRNPLSSADRNRMIIHVNKQRGRYCGIGTNPYVVAVLLVLCYVLTSCALMCFLPTTHHKMSASSVATDSWVTLNKHHPQHGLNASSQMWLPTPSALPSPARKSTDHGDGRGGMSGMFLLHDESEVSRYACNMAPFLLQLPLKDVSTFVLGVVSPFYHRFVNLVKHIKTPDVSIGGVGGAGGVDGESVFPDDNDGNTGVYGAPNIQMVRTVGSVRPSSPSGAPATTANVRESASLDGSAAITDTVDRRHHKHPSTSEGASFVWSSLVFVLVYLVVIPFCFTLAVPTGIFAPSFAIGAAFGRVFSEIFYAGLFLLFSGIRHSTATAGTHHAFHFVANYLSPQGHPYVYALIGATAFISTCTHTLSSAILIAEMQVHISMLYPCLLGGMIGVCVSKYIMNPPTPRVAPPPLYVAIHQQKSISKRRSHGPPSLSRQNSSHTPRFRGRSFMATRPSLLTSPPQRSPMLPYPPHGPPANPPSPPRITTLVRHGSSKNEAAEHASPRDSGWVTTDTKTSDGAGFTRGALWDRLAGITLRKYKLLHEVFNCNLHSSNNIYLDVLYLKDIPLLASDPPVEILCRPHQKYARRTETGSRHRQPMASLDADESSSTESTATSSSSELQPWMGGELERLGADEDTPLLPSAVATTPFVVGRHPVQAPPNAFRFQWSLRRSATVRVSHIMTRIERNTLMLPGFTKLTYEAVRRCVDKYSDMSDSLRQNSLGMRNDPGAGKKRQNSAPITYIPVVSSTENPILIGQVHTEVLHKLLDLMQNVQVYVSASMRVLTCALGLPKAAVCTLVANEERRARHHRQHSRFDHHHRSPDGEINHNAAEHEHDPAAQLRNQNRRGPSVRRRKKPVQVKFPPLLSPLLASYIDTNEVHVDVNTTVAELFHLWHIMRPKVVWVADSYGCLTGMIRLGHLMACVDGNWQNLDRDINS